MLIRAATLSLDERAVDVSADECRVQICKDGVPILDANSHDGSSWQPLKTSAEAKCTCHFKYAANDPNASHFASVDESDTITFRVLGRRQGSDERYSWTLGLASEGAKSLAAKFYNDCSIRLPPDDGDTAHGRAFGALIVKAKLMPRDPPPVHLTTAMPAQESVAECASSAAGMAQAQPRPPASAVAAAPTAKLGTAIPGAAPSSTKEACRGAREAAALVPPLAHEEDAQAHASSEEARHPISESLQPPVPSPALAAPPKAARGTAARGTAAAAHDLDALDDLASLRRAVDAEDKEAACVGAEVVALETRLAELKQLSAGTTQELEGAQSALQGGRADLRAARLHQVRARKAHVALQLDNTHRMLAAILDEIDDLEERFARKQRGGGAKGAAAR